MSAPQIVVAHGPPSPPAEERNAADPLSAIYLGTKRRLPEFNLTDKVVCVSGAARGLGLTQAEALLEAGATVYALDRLEEPVSQTRFILDPPLVCVCDRFFFLPSV